MFSRTEFERRVACLRTEMARHDVDAMIVDHTEFMAWLSGYLVSETLYRGMIVPREGEPWIILRKIDEDACRRTSWIGNVVGFGDSEDPVGVFADVLRKQGLAHGRIGADFNSYGFTAAVKERYEALLPGIRFTSLLGISDRLRTSKSQAEIDVLARAAAIADDTMADIANAMKTGESARSAYALAASQFVLRGADSGDVGPIVKAHADYEAVHGGLTADPLDDGDILNVELIPRVAGYSSRLIRPICVGRPSASMERAAERLIAIQDQQLAAIRPGRAARDIDAILRDRVLEQGLRSPFTNVSGYTLGIYGRTQRIADFSYSFHPEATWTVEEGMVLHMCVFGQRLGFSETVVVTPEGAQRLTRTPRRILAAGERLPIAGPVA